MSFNNIEEVNQLALKMLTDGDFNSAQYLFRQNAKKFPCCTTFNNLGVYYINEGMELQNGKIQSARKLGFKYLKMAEKDFQSHRNLMAIGDFYFSEKDFDNAINYFMLACKLNNHYVNFNNLGASLYMQRNYKDASTYFLKALEHCNCSDYSDIYPARSTIYSSYAFSLLQFDKEKCLDILGEILGSDVSHIVIDEFILAYLCNDLKLAKNLCQRMFDTWRIDLPVIAMVFDCLFDLNERDEAEKYRNYQLNQLEGYSYDTKPEINKTKKLFIQPHYRKEVIAKYHYIPPAMKYCYYVGCDLHNQYV